MLYQARFLIASNDFAHFTGALLKGSSSRDHHEEHRVRRSLGYDEGLEVKDPILPPKGF
jgi:hypothetical protein